jgi:hypothetical protein
MLHVIFRISSEYFPKQHSTIDPGIGDAVCFLFYRNVKRKAIPVTGLGGPYGCEMSRLPHFPDSRLTDGREFVSLTRRPPFATRKISDTHFC